MKTQSGATGANTFPAQLLQNAENFGEKKAAFREKEFGIWQSYSWAETLRQVTGMANGLASLGLKRDDKVAVVGDNRPHLYWGMLAAQCLGGVPVPLYQDSIEREMQYVTEHAEARFAVVENQEQVDKLLNIKKRCPKLEYIIYSNSRGLRKYDQPFLMSLDALKELGREFAEKKPDYFRRELEKVKPGDLAVICYTSGTTGKPKGVMLTHQNFIATSRTVIDFEGLREDDSVIAYLPMAWVGDFFASIGLALTGGITVNCPENADTVLQNIREVGPTYFFAPPRIWENLLTTVMIKMEDTAWIKRKMFAYFMAVAKRVQASKQGAGGNGAAAPATLMDRAMYQVGRFLVYAPLKDTLGLGKVRTAITAGEAIGPEIFAFFRSLGINLKQLYGSTEASVFVSVQRNDDVRLDTCGPPVPGVEVKITDSGEVIFRGPGVFKGYYRNPKATKETLRDGWVYTGDAGFLDTDGHLKIIDRVKDVSTLADGTMFAPKYVENKLKFSPYIKEAVTVGMDRPYVTAMINIDLDAVGNWAERRNLNYTSYTDLAQKPEVYGLVREEVRRVNVALAEDDQLKDARIHKFLILHKELDPDDEEITRTRKIRRGFVGEKYAKLIDAMYQDKDHVQVKALVTFEDGRSSTISADLKITTMEMAS